jgi:CopG antitoxin of type II toxin-antitoxin system
MKKTTTKKISAEEFDRRFDAGEDMSEYFDWEKATRPGLEPRRTTLDLPAHLLKKLDREAALRGVTRQSLIKMWLFERVEEPKQSPTR